MVWQSIFAAIFLIAGIALAIFARPIAIWDYEIDKKWKFLVMLGLPFRVWFLRIGGILLALAGLFVLAIYLVVLKL